MDKPFCQVHIRVQQRNGRKSITFIEGVPTNLNLEQIVKFLKKELCCNGCIIQTDLGNKIIQLQGDQREKALVFLMAEKIIHPTSFKIHGM
mmetsp:Transcript_41979/g.65602  ORF Transcript_41979/g.65602 Transcript_41979/m.65602 type:complete len:91 (-) Transcript_41979:201-473(-)